MCVYKRRKVAKEGEAEWVEGGKRREKKKVGKEPGGRVATHSGPSGVSAMRRVTLFLNGSPRNGKVREPEEERGPGCGGKGHGVRSGLARQRAEVGGKGWEVGVSGLVGVWEVKIGSPQPPPNPQIPTSSLPFGSPAALGNSAGQLVLNRSQVPVWGPEGRGHGSAAVI